MQNIKILLKQSSLYFVGHVLVYILGFVSYPVWTRIFTVSEYGILSLVNVTIYFVVAISKFGLQKSVLRFYSEFRSKKRKSPIPSFYTSLSIGSIILSGLVGLIFWVVIRVLGPNKIGGRETYDLFTLAIVLVVTGSVSSVLFSFLRVEQKPKLYTSFNILQRYAQFGLSVLLVVVFLQGVRGIFVSSIFVESFIVLVLILLLWRQDKIILSTFSTGLLLECLRFGIPLVSAELANVLSNTGDRYVLQFFLGSQAVGLYSAGYNLTSSLQKLLSVPMMLAITPMYVAMWEEQGRKRTQDFLNSVLDYYLMVAIPCIILFSFLGGDIIKLLASSKYLESRVILPYLALPLILYGANSIYAAGLFIQKKTVTVMYFTLAAGLLNLILNIILVPQMGLVGAAIATLLSYSFLMTLTIIYSSKYLSIQIKYQALVKYILASFTAVIILRFVNIETFLSIIIKLFIGIMIYSTIIMVIDERIRQKIRIVLKF